MAKAARRCIPAKARASINDVAYALTGIINLKPIIAPARIASVNAAPSANGRSAFPEVSAAKKAPVKYGERHYYRRRGLNGERRPEERERPESVVK
jgi:hypothetical protein